MIQRPELKGPRKEPPERDTTVFIIDEQSLPFDRPDFDQMTADQQRWLLEGYLSAQDAERIRIGQELHDSTGQLLVALRLDLARLKELDAEPEAQDMVREIELTVVQIEKEIRAFSFLHYPTELNDDGLDVALRRFVRGFGQRTGLDAEFQNLCQAKLGNGPVHFVLLRVAQEALINVYRHAHASSVRISISDRKGTLKLCIEDDGQGLPDDAGKPGTGVGLRSMRHRLESHGGRLVLRRLKQGTKVSASVPIDLLRMK